MYVTQKLQLSQVGQGIGICNSYEGCIVGVREAHLTPLSRVYPLNGACVYLLTELWS